MTTTDNQDTIWLQNGPNHRPSDMRTRSGYPIWQLISVWRAREQSDQAIIDEYNVDPVEWSVAKAFYYAHQAVMDARRILNDEEIASSTGTTLEELLARHADRESSAG